MRDRQTLSSESTLRQTDRRTSRDTERRTASSTRTETRQIFILASSAAVASEVLVTRTLACSIQTAVRAQLDRRQHYHHCVIVSFTPSNVLVTCQTSNTHIIISQLFLLFLFHVLRYF